LNTYRPDGSLDIQVEAFVGYLNVTYVFSGCVVIRQEDYRTEWYGQTSGWSVTQTAIIPNGAYTPTTPYPLPSISLPTAAISNNQPTIASGNQQIANEFSFTFSFLPLTTSFGIIISLLIVIALLLVLLLRKNLKTAPMT
jgi:hypothetical protein